MEVAPGIHRIETSFGDRTNAVYLLSGSRRSLLIDTTTKDTAGQVLDACAKLGAGSPSWVITTHADWDHAAGNGVIRQRSPDSRLCCHQSDRAMIEDIELMIDDRYGEFAVVHGYDESPEAKDAIRAGTAQTTMDLSLTGGERFDLGDGWQVEVLHTPGHSRGSVSVVDPRSNAVIVGDAVLGAAVPLSDGSPAFPPTYRYLDPYLATIDGLAELAPDLLLTSHYPIYRGSQVGEFLDQSRHFTERVEAALTTTLAGSADPIGLLEVASLISADLGDWPAAATPALLFPLHGHLERQLAAGKVTPVPEDQDTLTRYRWVVGR